MYHNALILKQNLLILVNMQYSLGELQIYVTQWMIHGVATTHDHPLHVPWYSFVYSSVSL